MLHSTCSWPYIDSEINYIRHFIKFNLSTRGLNSVTYPVYLKINLLYFLFLLILKTKESPIICYKYNKPIRITVFKFNKLVTELDIENSIPGSEIVKTLSIAINPLAI